MSIKIGGGGGSLDGNWTPHPSLPVGGACKEVRLQKENSILYFIVSINGAELLSEGRCWSSGFWFTSTTKRLEASEDISAASQLRSTADTKIWCSPQSVSFITSRLNSIRSRQSLQWEADRRTAKAANVGKITSNHPPSRFLHPQSGSFLTSLLDSCDSSSFVTQRVSAHSRVLRRSSSFPSACVSLHYCDIVLLRSMYFDLWSAPDRGLTWMSSKNRFSDFLIQKWKHATELLPFINTMCLLIFLIRFTQPQPQKRPS